VYSSSFGGCIISAHYISMPLPCYRHPGVVFSIGSCVCYQTCVHDILQTNEPILMQIDISGPQGMGMKRSTSGVTRSKVKITRGRSWRPDLCSRCSDDRLRLSARRI